MPTPDQRAPTESSASGARAGQDINKAIDAWWTVLLIDPVAVPLTRALRPIRWCTPTRVTLVAHGLGLVCASLFAAGWLVAAAILFEVRFVLDCVDGKLARLRGTSSNVGRFADYVGDMVVVSANFCAVAVWVWSDDGLDPRLAAALPLAFTLMLVCEAARDAEAAAAGIEGRRDEAGASSGTWTRWMAKRRLRPYPGRVDAEHLVLFVAPIAAAVLDDATPLVIAGALASVYFAYRTARFLAAGALIARRRDGGAS